IAHGKEASAPPCAAAIARSASMAPAIGACTIGNSVLKRSRSRRSGHMVSAFERLQALARASLPEPNARLAFHDTGKLCIHATPDACYASAMPALILPLIEAA